MSKSAKFFIILIVIIVIISAFYIKPEVPAEIGAVFVEKERTANEYV